MNGWFSNVNWADIAAAAGDTIVMLAASLALTIVLGLPLGVLLYVTGKRQIGENRVFHGLLGVVINVLRSVPFIILLIVMIPLTVALVGTSLGVVGAILPLVVGAAPFYARLVEGALREVDRTTIEATQAMGATPLQIVTGTLIPEALPGLISGATVTAVALVSFTAMAGVVGAGGLGDLAIRFGYQRFQTDVMIVTVALLVLLVQAIQLAGDRLAAAFTRR